MKKLTIFLTLAFLTSITFSQTKNGTIYSEHNTIEKTKNMWNAFVKGDKDTYLSFFADSLMRGANGDYNKIPNERLNGTFEWWNKEFENLEIKDDKPASPDALEYKEGGLWVQDWLRITATHIKTGIIVDLQMHNLYRFNDDGKINFMHSYFNNNIFEEIQNSQTTRRNGDVYINHPLISTVRKMMNDIYYKKDVEAWASYFTEKARFMNTTMPVGKSLGLEEMKEEVTKFVSGDVKFKLEQNGYPDCIHYEEGDIWSVYSWWVLTRWENEEKIQIPMMATHYFDEDGKITNSFVYYSTNHFEK
ncbi:nuclear transport factor 2 family protein [Sunxiuqinia sp. A32]|uniref:nuclear transport factor 2 family protein n=1 Tax=Sunxiuqinia sp. A32 TaxID=3461496 RepID=UPI0040462BD7